MNRDDDRKLAGNVMADPADPQDHGNPLHL